MTLLKLLFSPVRILLFVARVVGYGRFAMFVLGVFVGLAFAPTTGARFRARLRDLIAAEASDTNKLPADPTEIESVLVVRDKPATGAPQPGQVPINSARRETVAIIGCGIVLVALIVVFFIGVATVLRWCFG